MRMALLLALLMLSACGSLNDPGEGGVTKREAQQLNEAAAALDDTAPAPNVANTPIPVVPQPPADPELEAEANAS